MILTSVCVCVVADTVVCAPPQHEQNLKYVIRGTDSQIVELVAGGAAKPVPFSERDKWAELAKNYRIHEFDLQVRESAFLVVWTSKKCLQAFGRVVAVWFLQCAHIAKGLAEIIPERAAKLCTWETLELLVCGDPSIDVALLKEHTSYIGWQASHKGCKRFWRVFEGFTYVVALHCGVRVCTRDILCV